MKRIASLLSLCLLPTAVHSAQPQHTTATQRAGGRYCPALVVTVENHAPAGGTFQTPVWVGLHDGTFDSYDAGLLASALPLAGSGALERLAEDGDTGPLASDFSNLQASGVDRTLGKAGDDPAC